MERKNIFDIVSAQFDLPAEVQRMDRLFREERTVSYYNMKYTIKYFVDNFCFSKWKNRGRYIDIEDYLKAIDYEKIIVTAKSDSNSFLLLIELIYNFWIMVEISCKYITKEEKINFHHVQTTMTEYLSHYNYEAVYD